MGRVLLRSIRTSREIDITGADIDMNHIGSFTSIFEIGGDIIIEVEKLTKPKVMNGERMYT
jgi:hypothetical protein